MQKLRIGVVQMQMSKNKDKNISKAISLIKKAAKQRADIICLPELFNTLYFPQDEQSSAKKFAEPIPGKTTNKMLSLSKELEVAIIVPLYEKSGSKYYNSIVVVEDGKILGKYRKTHIPHDPLFYEKNYFEKGNTGFKIFKTKKAKISILICFDQWFPEAARASTLKGADILFYPTAIGWIKGYKAPDNWLESWLTIQKSHTIANGIHVVGVNRVGLEVKLDFWGNSFVTDAFGKFVKKAGGKEGVFVAEIDLSNNERIRKGWGFLRNRVPDSYKALVKKKTSQKVSETSPLSLNYSFPAEWEKHSAVYLAWPHDKITFPQLAKVEHDFAKIIKALQVTKSEKVKLFVTGKPMLLRAKKILSQNKVDLKKIVFFEHKYADVWFRDYGPTFLVNREKKKLAFTQWIFNSWGNKYKELLKDRVMPSVVNRKMKVPVFNAGFVNEGGAIETNGNGVILTTESCLLNKNRNPSLSKDLIEENLKHFLGAEKVIWLKIGFPTDHTDGHIDNLARFVDENTILFSHETKKNDENYSSLAKNYQILKSATNADGKKFNLVKLPVPKVFDSERNRMAASYTNFYIANNCVLKPVFNVPQDKTALKIISKHFRGRNVIPIDCSNIISGGGTIHCITQQEPKV